MKLQGQSKSLLFLAFIFVVYCIECLRQLYSKDKNEGFSKASDDTKMSRKIMLFIILTVIFYVGVILLMSSMSGVRSEWMIPMTGMAVIAPGTLAYYLSFVLIVE